MKKIVVLTGAGMSAESGMSFPDFSRRFFTSLAE